MIEACGRRASRRGKGIRNMLELFTGLRTPDADNVPASSSSVADIACRLLYLIRAGAFVEVLRDPVALRLLPINDAISEGATDRARVYLGEMLDEDKCHGAVCVIAVGAAALSLFAHANWLGARVCHPTPVVPHAQARCAAALSALSVDGEAVYDLVDAPRLLCAARALLVNMSDALSTMIPNGYMASWWAARCMM